MNTELSTRIESKIDRSITASTGLTTTGAMNFQSVEQIMEFSKIMSIASVAIPKHLRENPGACLAIALQASEWNMSPFAVANKSYVVNDRIAFEAQLINAVILMRAPIQGRFKVGYSGEGEKLKCKVSAILKNGETVDYESPEIGKITTKNSPLWKSDPSQQLYYFSSRSMCRRHFPDVILGVYSVDELQDTPIEKPVTGRTMPTIRTEPAKQIEQPKTEERPVEQPAEEAPEQTPAPEPDPEPAKEPTPAELLEAMFMDLGYVPEQGMEALKAMNLCGPAKKSFAQLTGTQIETALASGEKIKAALEQLFPNVK